MKLAALTLAMTLPALASAQPLGAPEYQRTASWYLAHPYDLKRMTIACRNDPGHAGPDCVNAAQARLVLAERQATAAVGDPTPPSNPRYWTIHPDEYRQKVQVCANITDPLVRHHNFCDSAMMAGAGR